MKQTEKKQLLKQGVAYISDSQLENLIGREYLEAAVEYTRRKAIRERTVRKVTKSADAAEAFRPHYIGRETEMFSAMFLNRNNDIIAIREISSGGLTGCIADPRVIFKEALLMGASCLIVCHNHPSGNLKPSEADRALTKKLKQGAQLLDIALLDHVIITRTAHYSFADEGEL